jgi:hypothetical protein
VVVVVVDEEGRMEVEDGSRRWKSKMESGYWEVGVGKEV